MLTIYRNQLGGQPPTTLSLTHSRATHTPTHTQSHSLGKNNHRAKLSENQIVA